MIGLMRLFVVGPPCSGKSTVSQLLRERWRVNTVDMDDEIMRLNGGTWPTIEVKEAVLQPQVLAQVVAMDSVILFNSYMQVSRTAMLRGAGFLTVLLAVDEQELRRRDQQRLADEGWSNGHWLDWHQANVAALQDAGQVDAVVSGEQDPEAVAEALLVLGDRA